MSSHPGDLVAVGEGVYFAAISPAVGRELWFVGPQGVTLAADLEPGAIGSSPRGITAFGTGIAFVANNSFGTHLFAVPQPGQPARRLTGLRDIGPAWLVAAGSRFFFVADDGVHGTELWVSDGTNPNTRMVADINPGAGDAIPISMVPFRNGVAFFVNDGVHGLELWVSDGTATGTRMVRDLNPGLGVGAAFPHSPPAVLNNELYFAGDDGISGRELWASDGTQMRQVADIVLGPDSSAPGAPTVVGNSVVFGIGGLGTIGLMPVAWVTDGTGAGTRQLGSSAFTNPEQFTRLGSDRLVFAVHDAVGSDLAVTDGTSAGTARLNAFVGTSHAAAAMSSAGSLVYVRTGGGRLFATDGTAAGTREVLASTVSVNTSIVGLGNGTAYFAGLRSDVGTELFFTAGSISSTRLIADLDTTPTTQDAHPRFLGGIGGRTVFAAATEQGHRLMATNGTAAGTRAILPLTGTANQPAPTPVAALNDALVVYDEQGGRLLATDGTAAGTRALGSLQVVGARSYPPVGGAIHGGLVLFSGGGSGAGNISQLWRTDGTAAGTGVLVDIFPGGNAYPRWFTRGGDVMYFVAQDAMHGHELWRTDGTAAGTTLVAEVQPGVGSTISILGACGGKVIFTADDGVHGREPWVCDGTAAGTSLLLDLTPGATSTPYFYEPNSVCFGGRLIFSTSTGTYGTDGTTAGTQELPIRSFSMVALQDHVLAFVSEQAGLVMYTTDGTVVGTRRVGYVGPATYATSPFAVSSREAVFRVGAFGVEEVSLFRTDGTLAGTSSLGTVVAGNSLDVDGRVYFVGRHPTLGSELWVLDVGATAQREGLGCGSSVDAVELRATAPRLGRSVEFALDTPHAAHALLLGAVPGSPIALGPPSLGCALFVALDQMVAAPMGSRLNLGVPVQVGLLGLRLGAQAVSGPSAPLGFDLSNGVRLVLHW